MFYLCNTFPSISLEKIKMGIFDSPDIRKLVKNPHCLESMNDVESRA